MQFDVHSKQNVNVINVYNYTKLYTLARARTNTRDQNQLFDSCRDVFVYTLKTATM